MNLDEPERTHIFQKQQEGSIAFFNFFKHTKGVLPLLENKKIVFKGGSIAFF
jgi:hypothetical protein